MVLRLSTFIADVKSVLTAPGPIGGTTPGAGSFTTIGGTRATLSDGATFGAQVGASNADFSKHVSLFSNSYGIGITASRLNYVAGGGAVHVFMVGTADVGSFSDTGLTIPGALNAGTLDGGTF